MARKHYTIVAMEAIVQTVFLSPGTEVVFLVDGKKRTDVIMFEVEIPLISVVGNNTYIVKWPPSPSGEATATEPLF